MAMSDKPKLTITSRYRAHKAPTGKMTVVRGEFVTSRLSISLPVAKETWTYETLVKNIDGAPDGTLFFLDTSIYKYERNEQLWDALLKRDIVIPPMIHSECRDWRNEPWGNDRIHRAFLVSEFVSWSGLYLGDNRELAPGVRCPQTLTIGPRYQAHGYEYLVSLLALRKLWGPWTWQRLKAKLGREPTQDEFAADVQGQLGPRGLMLAKEGLEKFPSPNLFTDEQLVVCAMISGIVRKHDICILTKDADVEEQFYKCAALLARQYEAMIVGNYYSANPDKLKFGPSLESGRMKGIYENDSFIECRLPRLECRKLYPANYHPVKILCLLIGGDNKTLKVTHIAFNAETEMAELLKLKSLPGALNCDKFGDKNVRVSLLVDDPNNPINVVHIGKETRMQFPDDLEFSQPDSYDVLHEHERIIHYE